MNAAGEVLCVTFQGVARHIGVDGREEGIRRHT